MGKRVGSVVGLVAMSLLAACSSFGAEDEDAKQPDGTTPGRSADDPKANAPMPPSATPPASEITEQFGYFVTEKGNDDSGDGTRAKPFATIGKGLSKAKVDGKRIYVCSGKYIEAVTLEDGVSMIGSYDCSQAEWSMSAKKSRIESPTSPALRARDIKTLTRFEGFDVAAPDAVDPSGSSIGLIAEGSDKLTIVSSRITAGSGAAGKAGVEGIQLSQAGSPDGKLGLGEANYCRGVTCPTPIAIPSATPAPLGGTSLCSGAPGFNGGAGGRGGHGGMYESSPVGGNFYIWASRQAPLAGEVKSGAAGGAGVSAAETAAIGKLSEVGYVPADGEQGKDGAPGEGGRGANGDGPPSVSPFDYVGQFWHGRAGGGGGAGGCPGLAGTAGKGGGASIALLLLDSAIKIEKSEVQSATGGVGGRGTFGSQPTPGGAGGFGPAGSGTAGGAGGEAGVSGSGAGGPSFAIAHRGPAPSLVGSTAKPGKGGSGSAEESFDGKVLPASPNGESKDVFAF